jgi:hypothetical protein
MNFKEALQILNIEDYGERIFSSNSQGELFHLYQYVELADIFKDNSEWFRSWFEGVVKGAELTWDRPESVFQHVGPILSEQLIELEK